MILTCPSCKTRYNVKPGAVPPQGRTVRCAACGNKWHAVADNSPEEDAERASVGLPIEPTAPQPADDHDASVDAQTNAPAELPRVATAPDPVVVAEAEEQAAHQAEDIDAHRTDDPGIGDEPVNDIGFTGPDMETEDGAADGKSRRGIFILAFLLLLVAIVAAFIVFAPPAMKEQVGLSETGTGSPLEVMLTRQNRSILASGNEVLTVGGRVINSTEMDLDVPPIRAQVRRLADDELLYSWTIAPPVPTLGPGESASFNSAETDIPVGDEQTEIVLVLGG